MVTRNNCFQILLLLTNYLLLSLGTINGGNSLKLESGVQIRCFENEKEALLKFKEEIIDEYGRLSTWGDEESKRDCCKWRGVYCHNRTNHVVRLDFRASSGSNGHEVVAPLQGKSISPSLLELQDLEYLDLSLNHFDGAPIPDFIGSFKNLSYLNLSLANFYGSIPHHIGNLSKLHYLILENSQLYSNDLEWLSHLHDLEYLNLNSVNLSMATNWLQAVSKLNSIKELHLKETNPQEILPSSFPVINTSASTLTVLDLSFNHISSSKFHWFLNFSSSLTLIDLSYNNISGPIPIALENMMSLEYLDLSYNSLEGGIPKSFGNISSLIHLNLTGNSLTGQPFEVMMNLSGPVETKLQYLDLSWNKMSGSFPDVVKFSSLKELRLGGYQLMGSIPAQNLRLPNLVVLDLSYNNLTGPVPDLSFCTSLKVLNLEKNEFNGTLTKSIGGLSKLEFLSLGSNLLQDLITEDHLFNLSLLQTLDLSSNSLLSITFSHGPFQLKYAKLSNCKLGPQFPKWIQNQKKLIYLDMSSAAISDTIPIWFGHLASKLTYLNASNNQIFGFFPNFMSYDFNLTYKWEWSTNRPSLKYPALDLSRNNISGSVNFLCHTPYWGWIDLSDNQLSDQLPNCFANFKFLRYLDLANNNFSGKIPPSFGSLQNISWLHLRNNSFSGEIPASLISCEILIMLDLGENRLTGKIPAWIGDGFSNLVFLRLSSNEFFGSIPSSICGLKTLQFLDLSSNNIHGVIPKCLSNLSAMTIKWPQAFLVDTTIWDSLKVSPGFHDCMYFMWKGREVRYTNHYNPLKIIDLSSNNLAGEIPVEIAKLDGLISLNFSRNNLTGYIPQNIGELRDLNALDLSRNHLSGSIPESLSELSHLGFLNLSYNDLSGRIPENSHMLTIDESAYIGNPGLCGHLILNKSCSGNDETYKSSNFNLEHEEADDDDDDDKFITQGFYVAMWLGFVIGICGIFGAILFNKSVRSAFLKVWNSIEDSVYVIVKLSKGS